MRPKIDTALVDRLIAQAEARQAAAPVATVSAPVASKPEPAQKPAAPRVPPVRAEPITVALEVEIVDDLVLWLMGYLRA